MEQLEGQLEGQLDTSAASVGFDVCDILPEAAEEMGAGELFVALLHLQSVTTWCVHVCVHIRGHDTLLESKVASDARRDGQTVCEK